MKRDEKNNGKIVVHPATIQLWVNDSWNIAHSLLWKNCFLRKKAISDAKILITKFYTQIPASMFSQFAPEKFHQFCICILECKDRFCCSPDIWFDGNYPDGFYSNLAPYPSAGLNVNQN